MSASSEPRPSEPPQGRKPTEDELGTQVVLGIHRLAKQSTLYDSDNEAAVRQLEMTREAVAAYGRQVGVNPKIFFTEKSVFVGGRLLRAGRTVYAAAIEVGNMLRSFGIDEVAIGFDVPLDDLRKFQDAVRAALRKVGPSPAKQKYARIRLRQGHEPGRRPGERDADLPPEQRIMRVYATATVVMRRYFERVAQGEHRLPVGVRRVAQQLADFGGIDSPGYLGKLAVHNIRDEDASRAVNSALVAIGMARQLTHDKRLLARLAMGAMLFDVGKPRVAGMGPTGEGRAGSALPRLAAHQLSELPAATAAVTWAAGGFGQVAQVHTVMSYEALTVAYRGQAEPAYGGLRAATTAARIVATARGFTELLADPAAERTVDQTICTLLRRSGEQADRTILRLLLGTIGALPSGALVQLQTGITAQVVQTRDEPLLFARPVVRAVMDGSGGSISEGALIDLGTDGAPAVARVVDLGRGVAAEAGASAAGAVSSQGHGHLGGAPPVAAPRSSSPAPQSAPQVAAAVSYPQDALDVALPPAEPPARPPDPPAQPVAPVDLASATQQVPTRRPAEPMAPPGQAMPQGHGAATAADDGGALPDMLQQALVDGRAPGDGEDERTAIFTERQRGTLAAALAEQTAGQAPERDEGGDKTAVFTDGQRRQLAALLFPGESDEADEAAGAGGERHESHSTQPRPAAGDDAKQATTPRPQRPRGIRAALAAGTDSPPRQPLAMAPARQQDARTAEQSGGVATAAAPPPPAPASRPAQAPQSPEHESAWLREVLAGRTPTARGALSKTPLVHLLVYSLDQRLTGTTMLLAPTGARHFIFFDQGVPAKARTPIGVAPLDRVLVDMGVLDTMTLQQSLLAISKSGGLHGRYLVDHGLLDEAALMGALTWQLVQKVAHMLQLPCETRYAFYQGSNLLDGYGGPELTPAEPLLLIMAGVRMLAGQPLVEQTLARLGNTPLRIRREADLTRLALHEDERLVVDMLRTRPNSLRELLAREVAQPWVVQLTAYALMITRCLNLGAQGHPPVGHGVPRVPMPPVAAPRHPAAHSRPDSAVAPADAGALRAPPPTAPSSPEGPPASPGALPRRGAETGRRLQRRATSTGRGLAAGRASAPGEAPVRRPAPPPLRRRAAPPTSGEREAVEAAAASGEQRPAAPAGARAQGARSSAPAPHRAGDEVPTRELISRRFGEIDDQTYYQILGVAQDADPSAIQSAYLRFVKRWHPDRLPAEVHDLKTEAAKIFARVNESYQTLIDPAKRRGYDEVVASGGGTAHDRKIVERVVDSAFAFQKAEVLFKKGSYDEAAVLVRQAVEADPEQPEYRAFLAWIEATRKGPPPALSQPSRAPYRDQLTMLDEVLKAEPEYERALSYRAQLLKRCGLGELAMRDFRLVAKLNPHNIDAAREVRLHSKRRQQSRGGGGLFGKLFGNKSGK